MCGVVWCGVVWCGVCGVVWCGVVWCGVCGVVWCGDGIASKGRQGSEGSNLQDVPPVQHEVGVFDSVASGRQHR